MNYFQGYVTNRLFPWLFNGEKANWSGMPSNWVTYKKDHSWLLTIKYTNYQVWSTDLFTYSFRRVHLLAERNDILASCECWSYAMDLLCQLSLHKHNSVENFGTDKCKTFSELMMLFVVVITNWVCISAYKELRFISRSRTNVWVYFTALLEINCLH